MNTATKEMASLGQILKAQREKLQLSANDVSQKLYLKTQVILDLEADSWESFDSIVYITGYLRGYAEILGLDANQLIEKFHKAHATQEEPLNLGFSTHPQQLGSRDLPVVAVTWLIVIVLLILLSFWHQTHYRDMPIDAPSLETTTEPTPTRQPPAMPAETPSPEHEAAATTPYADDPQTESTLPVEEWLTETLADADNEEFVPNELPQENPAKNAESSPEQLAPPETLESKDVDISPAPSAEAKTGNDAGSPPSIHTSINPAETPFVSLRLDFTANAWVEITDARKMRLFNDTGRAGQTQLLEGRPPFDLVIGNPNAVKIYHNGENVILQPHPFSGVARQVLE
ncbi:MAG: RodZ domain-containing protein [Candidatus Eutrophobiaceae bacterium]